MFLLVAGPSYLCQIKLQHLLCVTMDTMKILPSTNTIRGRQRSSQGRVPFCLHKLPLATPAPPMGVHCKRWPPGGRTARGCALLCRSTWLWLGVQKKLACVTQHFQIVEPLLPLLSRVAGSHCWRQCLALISCTFLEAARGLVWLWATLWSL